MNRMMINQDRDWWTTKGCSGKFQQKFPPTTTPFGTAPTRWYGRGLLLAIWLADGSDALAKHRTEREAEHSNIQICLPQKVNSISC